MIAKSCLAGLILLWAATLTPAAPQLSVVKAGTFADNHLDVNGNWVWSVQIAPDSSLFTDDPNDDPDLEVGGYITTELGFTSSREIISVQKNATYFPDDVPGNSPFGPPIDGVQSGIVTSGNNVFVSLRSVYFKTEQWFELFKITTLGPSTGADTSDPSTRTTALDWLGAYGGNGRITQNDQPFDIYQGTASRTATPGDADLVDGVDLTDYGIILDTLGLVGFWQYANFNNPHGGTVGTDSIVELTDFNILLDNLGRRSGGGGGANGVASLVPEPACALLASLAVITLLSFGRRRA